MNRTHSHRAYMITLLFFTWLTLTSEKCVQDNNCEESVAAVYMSDLDACGIILVTEDDKKLLPVNLGEFPTTINSGDQLKVSYTIIKDGMSICMAEDAMIRLTCVELISRTAEDLDCPKMTDPVDFTWSKKVLGEIELRHVERFTTDDGDYYMFRAHGDCRMYKCTGQLICVGTCNKNDECETYFASKNIKVTDTRVIYVQDN